MEKATYDPEIEYVFLKNYLIKKLLQKIIVFAEYLKYRC
jgi:hypothetical protein